MTRPDMDNTIARWSRLGVLFGRRPARRSPDLERLLLDTARLAPRSARLFHLAVTWLSQYGNFVARHRLKHLVETELARDDQPALGALVALAVTHGASRELLIAADACAPADHAAPLFDVQRGSPELEQIAHEHACAEAQPWNLWIADQPPKLDALRPATWIIEHNREYLERVIRKGDLRCSILLTLRHDTAEGEVESEAALARHCSANCVAVRHALDDLEREGIQLRWQKPGARNTRIVLEGQAASV